jgi:iron complex outermembrane receptor protein
MRTITLASAMLAGVALAAVSPAAFAQDAAPAATDAAADAGDAIVVTAERRQENIMSVPVSVAVMKPELLHDLQAGGADTLLSLAGRVPSLNVDRPPAASSRASTSVAWATSTSTSAPRSRSR